MKKIICLLFMIICINGIAQKKYNFGISLGSEQYYGNDKGYIPNEYKLENQFTNKLGVFVERNLVNQDQILVGFNYNYYWNYFTFMNGDVPWYTATSNTFYDVDFQYNRFLSNHFKVMIGTNVSFYRFHDKYYGVTYLYDGSVYSTEVNDVTDFNLALNSGIKYVINPKSKIKFEPFVLLGATLFRRDNFKVDYLTENNSSNHFYRNIYTRFGLNVKY